MTIPSISQSPQLFCLACLLLLGGGQAEADSPGGKIEGVVYFDGKAPARAVLDRQVDPVCAKSTKRSEAILVSDGKLKDVHIHLALSPGSYRTPTAPVVIRQTECMYYPRVVGIMLKQTLEIHNDDPTYHNVHGRQETKTAFNLGHPASAPPIVRKTLPPAGEILTLGCDVHPWMQAYAVVTAHPYFDVTKQDGTFTIDKIPPGSYTIKAWHPTLGRRSNRVRVRSGKASPIEIRFSRGK